MKKLNFIALFTILIVLFSCISMNSNKSSIEIDYVPDEITAIKIAEAIWLPLYGESIQTKKPFTAKLINNKYWRVEGKIGLDDIGGVPIIEIQKKDCKILSVTHTK